MLIKALCDYYDILEKAGKVLPEGYSKVKIHYLVCLTPEGKIDDIINWQKVEQINSGKGKIKEKLVPRDVIMPQRTEKSGIDANIVEHRPLYLFGLNFENGAYTTKDKTNKAKKSHEAFVQANLTFLEGLESPVVNAYRAFVENWIPQEEVQNPYLLTLGKSYSNSNFAFCLSGYADEPLHEDGQIKDKWNTYMKNTEFGEEAVISQCAISGETTIIARLHNKIKGIYGGRSTGNVFIGFNNDSEQSYGNVQSYNSNISETMMKKYTEVLNFLLDGKKHKTLLDDMTVLYWSMSDNENADDLMAALLFQESEKMDAQQTDEMLKGLMEDATEGRIAAERILSTENIDSNVEFYMVGLKPNPPRIAVKFIYRKNYAELLWNIVMHQKELQIGEDASPIPLWRIKKEMVSPKSKNETVDPALFSKVFEAMIYGTDYPMFLLSTMVKRVKLDASIKDNQINNRIRIGVIKACINRKSRLLYQKEEIKVALDNENKNPAYLCGRLFAALEKLQQDASGGTLNRTIKDAYFASATSRPAIVFPNLLKLAQNHLNKTARVKFYNILIGEILEGLDGQFPDSLLLADQGKFIIGYYQQYQNFFVKKEQKQENDTQEEKTNG